MLITNTIALVLASIILLLLSPSLLFTISNIAEATDRTTSIVSTRGHFNLNLGYIYWLLHDETSYFPIGIPSCSPALTDIVIFVHGYKANEQEAIKQFNLVKKSLNSVGFTQPVIGFSWDSYTIGSFYPPRYAWHVAIDIAEQNGLKLANFISNFKSQSECEHVNIRFVAHSLGARVVLNALKELHNDYQFSLWNQRNYSIASVHVLGGAVNPEELSSRGWPYFGTAIQHEVELFRNEYCPEDDMLQFVYRSAEGRDALGTVRARDIVSTPSNYDDVYVCDQIIPIIADVDGDGYVDTLNQGDNHMGYMGVVNWNTNTWVDDGAMDIVFDDW